MKSKCVVLLAILGVLMSGCSTGVTQAQYESVVAENESLSEEIANKQYTVDEEMTLKFSFGDRKGVYTGSLKNGIPDGYGTFSSTTTEEKKWTYYGEWSDGHFNGNGISEWETGSKYLGDYSNDFMHGTGVYWYEDGTFYSGEFKNGEFAEEENSNTAIVEYQEVEYGDIQFTVQGSWPLRSVEGGWYTYSPDQITNFTITAMAADVKSDSFLEDNLNKVFDAYSNVKDRTTIEGRFSSGETYLQSMGTVEQNGMAFRVLSYDFVCKDKIYLLIFITPENQYEEYKGAFNDIFTSIKMQ